MTTAIVNYSNYLFKQDGINHYLKMVSKIKMLTAEEESALAFEVVNNKSKEAANKLLISHLPLVVKLAYGYKGYGLPIADLISEGNIGLIQAITKFNPQKGFRLSTYAMFWIKAYITNYILDSWSLVKQGSVLGRKKLFFSLSKIKNKLGITALNNENIKQISQQTNVSENDVVVVNNMLTSRDVSFNAPVSYNAENSTTLEDVLPDNTHNPEEIYSHNQNTQIAKQQVQTLLSNLSKRESYILINRFAIEKPLSLDALSKKLNISRERVRQIEKAALKKSKLILQK